jgi:DNA invertase Pin-like site-specific DNA recombinase
MRVGIYTRLSRDMDGRQTATARQEKDSRALVRSKGWKVAEVYEDVDLSAYKRGVHRPAYERLLGDLSSGAIDGVVVWKLDRLVRRASEFERFWAVCEDANATLAAVHDPIDTSSDIGMVVVRMLVNFAQLEAANTSTRVKNQIADRAQKGGLTVYGGRRPFGFEADRRTHRPEEVKLIRDAVTRVIGGESVTRLAREWNEAGVTTTAGGKWTQTTLRRAIESPRAAGLLEHKGSIIGPAPWQPVIDRKTWEQLRAVLERRRGNQPQYGPRAHVLVGLARCGRCGSKLSALSPWGRRRTVTYICPMPSSGRGCGRMSIVGPAFENLVVAAVFEALASPQLARAMKAASSNGRDADLLKVIDEGRRTLEALDDDHYDGRLDRVRWHRQTARVTERVENAQRQLTKGTRAAVLGDLPGSRKLLSRLWEERDVAWRSELLGAVIEKVVVNPPRQTGRFDPERIGIVWRA